MELLISLCEAKSKNAAVNSAVAHLELDEFIIPSCVISHLLLPSVKDTFGLESIEIEVRGHRLDDMVRS